MTNAPVNLPIDSLEPQLKERLKTHAEPTVVVAPTGSGKSTRLPGWMAEALQGKVLIVEPRRVACRSLAKFLAGQRNEELGQSVGYRVRFEDHSSEKTQLLFVTPGVALRMMASKAIEDYVGVMLDEFHERSWETDLILALMVERFPKIRWLITSATIDAETLASRYQAKVMHSLGRTFPVSLHHLESRPSPSLDDLAETVFQVVGDILKLEGSQAGERYTPPVATLEDSDSGNQGRDILVFLPGKGEIGACRNACLPLQKKYSDFEIVIVHGGVPTGELNAAFQVSNRGRRRLYLSTNVAETSVTLPGVGWVVDSGLVRMRIHRGGRTVLALVSTSMASMEQRRGRAGRLRPGRCIRLFSKRYSPDPHPAPEMERMELDEVILRAASVGLVGNAFRDGAFPASLKEFAYERAMNRLLEIRLLDEAGSMTELGQAIAKLPVSIDEARVLVDAPKKLRGTLCDLVALMGRGDRLLLPMQGIRGEEKREDVMEARKELLNNCRHEVDTLLLLLHEGQSQRHHLNSTALKDTRKLSGLLRKLFQLSSKGDLDISAGHLAQVSRHLLRRVPEWVFVLRKRVEGKAPPRKKSRSMGEPWGNGGEEILLESFTPPFMKEPTKEVKAGIVLSQMWLGTNRGIQVSGVGRMLLPCPLKMLVEEDFGELEVTEARLPKGGGQSSAQKEGFLVSLDKWPRLNVITANQRRTYAGRVLDSSSAALKGRPLRMALAEMVAHGRWAPDLGLWLASELRAWFMSHHWGQELGYETMGDALPTPPNLLPLEENNRSRAVKSEYLGVQDYLLVKLQELGFEGISDWELIGADDLKAPLDELFHKKEVVLKDFPVRWQHQGSCYRTVVYANQRSVTLEPMNQNASKGKEPAGGLVPRFRGFSVYYQKADRNIKIR